MMYLNQFKLKLYQTYKDLMEEVQVGLLIQSQIRFLVFENTTTQLGQWQLYLSKESDQPKKV